MAWSLASTRGMNFVACSNQANGLEQSHFSSPFRECWASLAEERPSKEDSR